MTFFSLVVSLMNRDGKLPMRVFWTLLALVVCGMQFQQFFNSFRPKIGGPDFFQDWASARNYMEGVPIYTPQAQSFARYREVLHLAPDMRVQTQIDYNGHPPTAVLLALPLARWDFPDAFLAWSVASFVALCLTIAIVVWQCPKALTPWSILPLAALLLLCSPLRQQVFQGQLNLILLLLITAAWAADRSDRPWLAGALLGAATAIKLFPGYLFLYFAARRQWRPLAGGAAGFVLLSALALLVLGPACYRDYMTIVLPALAKWRVNWMNVSLAGFWHKAFNAEGSHVIPLWQNPQFAWTATLLSDALVTALVAACVWVSRSLRERELAFSLTLAAMLLVSPITWYHYFTLLLLPLFLLWLRTQAGSSLRMVFWILLILLWLPPRDVIWRLAFPRMLLQRWETLIATPGQNLVVLSLQTYVLLALFVFTILVLRYERAALEAPKPPGENVPDTPGKPQG